MSFCNILDNLARQFGSIFGESQRLIYAQASVSGIGLVPGRNIYGSLCGYWCQVSALYISYKRQISTRCNVGYGLVNRKESPWRLAPSKHGCKVGNLARASHILCKLTHNPITMHHTRQKLGCCIISYRTLIRFFSRQYYGNFFSNLKLSFNRSTPTPLLKHYLTYLSAIFVSFLYPEGDIKSTLGGAKC